jgi:protein TIF31
LLLKFANLPFGFRANTWLIPPVLLDPSSPSLPLEDENWGGNGGGQGRKSKFEKVKWATEFSILSGLPCKTEEERLIRDRKAFLLHGLFVDSAIFKATSAICGILENKDNSILHGDVIHEEKIGDLHIIVRKDSADVSLKRYEKVDGSSVLNLSQDDISKRNLLKGLTADESVVVKVHLSSFKIYLLLIWGEGLEKIYVCDAGYRCKWSLANHLTKIIRKNKKIKEP